MKLRDYMLNEITSKYPTKGSFPYEELASYLKGGYIPKKVFKKYDDSDYEEIPVFVTVSLSLKNDKVELKGRVDDDDLLYALMSLTKGGGNIKAFIFKYGKYDISKTSTPAKKSKNDDAMMIALSGIIG